MSGGGPRALLGVGFPVVATMALMGAADAVAASLGDALFLAEVGPRHIGSAYAVSGVLLIATLGFLGARADRGVAGVRIMAVVGICILAVAIGLLQTSPRAAAIILVVFGKQASASLELLMWVFLASRIDARETRKVWPVLFAVQGAGTALGGFSVGFLTNNIGSGGVLIVAAILYGGVAILAADRSMVPRPVREKEDGFLRQGARASLGSKLGRSLVAFAFAASLFAPILHYLVSVTAAAQYSDTASIAGFLGSFRGAVFVATLVAQTAITPRLFSRRGVAFALVVPPIVALIGAVAIAFESSLVVIAVVQGVFRIIDQSVSDPGERLAQNLLRPESRGRITGFIDGVAKRLGSILGAAGASLLVVWPAVLAVATLGVAAGWCGVSAWLRRKLPDYAVLELRGQDLTALGGTAAEALADERAILRLRRTAGSQESMEVSLDLLWQLSRRGRCDFARQVELVLDELVDSEAANRALQISIALACRDPAVVARGNVVGSHEEWARFVAVAQSEGELAPESYAERVLALVQVLRAEGGESLGPLLRTLLKELRASSSVWTRSLLFQSIGDALHEASPALGRNAEWSLYREQLRDYAFQDLVGRPRAAPQVRRAAMALIAHIVVPDEAPILAESLRESDEVIAELASEALARIGAESTAAVLAIASRGSRRARARALRLLAEIRVPTSELDAVIEREHRGYLRCLSSIDVLGREGGALLRKRLAERATESVETFLVAIEVRDDALAMAEAVRVMRHAQDKGSRARALEALDAALPARYRWPLISFLEEGPTAAVVAQAQRFLGDVRPSRAEVLRRELVGRDPLSRLFAVELLSSGEKKEFRSAIAEGAAMTASGADPIDILQRLRDPSQEENVPKTVDTIVALSQVPLFSELSTRELAELAGSVHWRSFLADEDIVREGEPGDTFFFIASGEVEVLKKLGDEERVLDEIGAGEPFGEMALFEEIPRTATVRAVAKTQVGVISRADFTELVDRIPDVALAICRVLSRRLREQTESS